MTSTRYVLDPTGERTVAERQRLDRPAAIAGLRDRPARHLQAARRRLPRPARGPGSSAAGAKVQRYRKPTFTKPAPVDLRHEIATQCDLVIEALAD